MELSEWEKVMRQASVSEAINGSNSIRLTRNRDIMYHD